MQLHGVWAPIAPDGLPLSLSPLLYPFQPAIRTDQPAIWHYFCWPRPTYTSRTSLKVQTAAASLTRFSVCLALLAPLSRGALSSSLHWLFPRSQVTPSCSSLPQNLPEYPHITLEGPSAAPAAVTPASFSPASGCSTSAAAAADSADADAAVAAQSSSNGSASCPPKGRGRKRCTGSCMRCCTTTSGWLLTAS